MSTLATPGTVTTAPAGAPASAPRFLRRLLRRPVAVVCLCYLTLLVAVAIVAPIAMPWVAHQQAGNLAAVSQTPSGSHLLGTDSLGRDELERLLVGTRVTMFAVAEALLVLLALGVPLGLVAGYIGGATDRVVTWLGDLTFSMPALIVVLVVLTVFPANTLAAMVTLGALASPFLMRVVRSATLPIREELYVAAAQVAGLSRRYIISRHVLPRVVGPIIVQASLFAGGALLAQTGLAYLGLLIRPPAPSWGGMLSDGIQNIVLQPWLIWPPGVFTALTILAFGLFGDAVRDATTETWQAPPLRSRRLRRLRRAHAGEMPRCDRRPNRAPDLGGNPDSADSRLAKVGDASADTPLERKAHPGPPSILRVEHVAVSFPSSGGPVPAVQDVSFDVAAGETVGIVGESGCGKTLTALSILGLLPGGAELAGGRIIFDGQDLARFDAKGLRGLRGKEIALISQEPTISLNPAFRVGWQIAHCVRLHQGVSRRVARKRAVELLARVRLPDPEATACRYPHELSGGMAQRVAIARALAGNPKLLIADEPTTALDVTIQAEILDLLRELQQDRGMAILLVTHDWGVVADICDRAIVMYAGQVVERAELEPMFAEPLHPYTKALLASNPYNRDAALLPTIPGNVPSPGDWPQGCHFHPRCSYATVECGERAIPLEMLRGGRETRCINHEELVTG